MRDDRNENKDERPAAYAAERGRLTLRPWKAPGDLERRRVAAELGGSSRESSSSTAEICPTIETGKNCRSPVCEQHFLGRHRHIRIPRKCWTDSDVPSHSMLIRRKALVQDNGVLQWCNSSSKQHLPKFSQIKTSFISNISLVLVLLILGCSEIRPAAGCSSRSTPKPRPPSQSAIRPNITFQTYACPPAYAAWYCLNGATCFTVKIADSILYNCECADGFMGQRCEFKDLDGSYLPTRERLLSLNHSSLGGALLFILLVIVVLASISAMCTRHRNKAKLSLDDATSIGEQENQYDLESKEGSSASYNMSLGGQSISYSISRHCDVIRGYNMESSLVSSVNRNLTLRPSNSNSGHPFNYRHHQTLAALSSTLSRQRTHNSSM